MNPLIKDIPNYSGIYKVSACGKVYSYRKNKLRLLKPQIKKSGGWKGYKVVTLYKNGKGKNTPVHRLVAKVFVDNSKGYNTVNHIDHNPLNNEHTNLEWCTQKDNVHHCIKAGRFKGDFGRSNGIKIDMTYALTPVKAVGANGECLYFRSIKEANHFTGMRYQGNISRAITKGCRCKGYHWKKLTATEIKSCGWGILS